MNFVSMHVCLDLKSKDYNFCLPWTHFTRLEATWPLMNEMLKETLRVPGQTWPFSCNFCGWSVRVAYWLLYSVQLRFAGWPQYSAHVRLAGWLKIQCQRQTKKNSGGAKLIGNNDSTRYWLNNHHKKAIS